jgi:DegV family protein with EDD domain
MTTALVTDSNAQLPTSLIDRYSITVVPISVVIDGVEFLEGVDIDADQFYEHFTSDVPEVSTSQPSPGVFAEVYQQLIADGHDEIVSVHVTASMSGTLNSARLGAGCVDAPVHFVDSRTASFGVGCCAWEIGAALATGVPVVEAVQRGERLADELYSVTALGAAGLFQASGRSGGIKLAEDGIDVFKAGPGGSFDSVGVGRTADEICDLMADTMSAGGAPIRIALGVADQTAAPYYEGLEARLDEREDVVEIVRYRIGPSVGAFTGPGTAGGFWYRVT